MILFQIRFWKEESVNFYGADHGGDARGLVATYPVIRKCGQSDCKFQLTAYKYHEHKTKVN